MSFRDPLRGTQRKRKQLSIDGTVAGIDYNQPRRGYDSSPFKQPLRLDLPHPAQAYDPDPGRPDFPEPQYEPYEAEIRVPATPPIRFEMPGQAQVEGPPSYDASLMTDELFEQAMQESAGARAPEPIPVDHDVRAQGIMNSQDTLEGLVAGSFPQDPVHEIEDAFNQQMAQSFAEPMQEPEPPPPPEPTPEQMYEDYWMMMNQFGMPGPI